MTFANFIFVVFLLLSLLVLAVLVMLMRQIKKDGRLAPEKMSTLAAVLFIPAIIFFILIYKGLSDWRTEIRLEENQAKIETFVQDVYQPLATSRRTLLSDLAEMRSLLRKIESMEISYPNHADLIGQVKKQWDVGQATLYQAYSDSDREVRRAWIAHNTLDSQDVLAKFSKQAVQLESQIKKARKAYETHLYSVQGEIAKGIDSAKRLLDAIRKPARTKQQRAKNQLLREKIRPFSSLATNELIAYLAQVDERLEQHVRNLQELIRLSGQQAAVMRDHLYQNKDLEQPLTRIISNWKELEADSRAHLEQILYVIEAEYIAVKLGLSVNSNAVKSLRKSLRVNVPAVVGKAWSRRKAIDQSYSIKK